MSKNIKEAHFITQWKDEMKKRIALRFKGKSLNQEKIEKYLDNLVHDYMVNPKVEIINNYVNANVQTDLLSLIDTINDNQLIIGGGGVLYLQHGIKDNVMYDYIRNLQELRNHHKKERKKYDKGTDEWLQEDIAQANRDYMFAQNS